MPGLVGAGDGEAVQGAGAGGGEGTLVGLEVEDKLLAFDGVVGEVRTRSRDVFAVGLLEGEGGVAMAEWFLVFGVEGDGVAGIDGHDHAGVGNLCIDEAHGFAVGRPGGGEAFDGGGLSGGPTGELGELEGEFGGDIAGGLLVPK